MAKRFIDTEIFKSPSIRKLPTLWKAFWIFLFTNCDHAGIWIKDFEQASLSCGGKITEKEANEKLFGKFVNVDNDQRWFLPGYIHFQYPGGLSCFVKAQNSAIEILKQFGLWNTEKQTLKEDLANPYLTVRQELKNTENNDHKIFIKQLPNSYLTVSEQLQDKDKDLDKDKDKDLDKDKDKYSPVVKFLVEEYFKTLTENQQKRFEKNRQEYWDCCDKLMRIDGFKEEEIRKAVNWARHDHFWSQNFLSFSKLRMVNKEGTRYCDVFLDKALKGYNFKKPKTEPIGYNSPGNPHITTEAERLEYESMPDVIDLMEAEEKKNA